MLTHTTTTTPPYAPAAHIFPCAYENVGFMLIPMMPVLMLAGTCNGMSGARNDVYGCRRDTAENADDIVPGKSGRCMGRGLLRKGDVAVGVGVMSIISAAAESSCRDDGMDVVLTDESDIVD